MAKLTQCKTCGAEIASSAKTCPSCGAKNKASSQKKLLSRLIVILAIIVFVAVVAGTSSDSGTGTSNEKGNTQTTLSKIAEAFDGDCGISASAEMDSNIIGYPSLNISIKNNTDKKIEAIKFYAVPLDVYGDEITYWTSQNKLYTDTEIVAGGSNSISFDFIEGSVKTLELYVYSVYFEDGTEWGDKDATKSNILKYGVPIEVAGES